LECIKGILAASFKKEPLEAYYWKQSDISSSWNIYRTDAAREGGSLDINNPVVGQHWTKYCELHFSLFTYCDPQEDCDCEGHDCIGAHSTVRYAAAAATPAKSLGITLINALPPTPTPFTINAYNWPW
jgi:hypothetical protein